MTASARGLPARIGRYEVELQLGQGRIGRVLLARDPVLERQVAVKTLRDDLAVDADELQRCARRLKEGARIAAALRHPGVLSVHDMGDDERSGAFVVLELVHGGSLRERLAQGRLPRSDVIHLARALGSTLSHAHANGIAHGNLKPENVLLSPAPKLTDFGGLAPPSADAPASIIARTAPEVLSGGATSAAGDQFTLAVILYEALAGVSPFPGDDEHAVADRVRATSYAPVTDVASDLRACPHIDAILGRALSPNPEKRFASCEAFAAALAASLEPAHVPLFTPTSRSSIVPRITRRWQNAAAGAAVVVIFALVLIGRQPRAEGVSLRSVAAAFLAAIAAPEAAPSPGRPPPPLPATMASAAVAPSSGTPSSSSPSAAIPPRTTIASAREDGGAREVIPRDP
jgi:eukaryotic-like serine/threonine-protein kinase